MTVLRRKLFNRGGPVSSRGVGITSGFTTPVRGYKFGGSALNQEVLTADAKIPETGLSEKIQSNMDMLRSTGLFPERKPFDTKEALTPYLLDVSARLLANKSKQGGIGGALDIAGQSLAGSTPLLSQALKEKRAYESTDPDAQMKQLALQLALKDDPEASITGEKITTVMKDGKAVQMLTYFKDGVYTEKVIGEAQPSEDSAVKGIPRDLFDTLSEKQQQEILIPSGDTSVKGIPRDIFDGLDTEDRNAVLGLIDNPDITSANIIEVQEGGKKVKKLTYFENGQYQEQVIGDVADDPIEIKGVPQDIYNDLNEDQKERLLGIDEAPQVIKGIPKDLFDGLSQKNQNIILGLGGEGIQNINIVEVLDTDGETPVKKLTYTQDGDFKQIDLGKAVPAKDGSTEAERAIESLKDLTNQKKSDYADILSQYGPLPSGDGSDIFTQADVDKIYQTAKNNLAKIKTTEQSNVISPEDAAAMTLNDEIIKKVVTPKMEKIEQTSNTAVKTLSIANGVKTAVEGFKPGFLVDTRLSIASFVDLLSPDFVAKNKDFLDKIRVGQPVSGDILRRLSAELTLRQAEGGALPGNLNTKEFLELKNAGLPLFTTKDGMLVTSELLTRESNIAIKAQEMLADIVSQQQKGETSFTITMPNGEARTFDNFYSALDEIEDFKIIELPKVYSGSEMMMTDDLTARVQGLGRYDRESFDLTGGVVEYNKKKFNAKDLEETGQLTFSHWGDLDNPNKNHRNKAVYIFNTGDLWTGNEDSFKSDIHVVGEPITAYWVKAN
jgi:hypothetical protein